MYWRFIFLLKEWLAGLPLLQIRVFLNLVYFWKCCQPDHILTHGAFHIQPTLQLIYCVSASLSSTCSTCSQHRFLVHLHMLQNICLNLRGYVVHIYNFLFSSSWAKVFCSVSKNVIELFSLKKKNVQMFQVAGNPKSFQQFPASPEDCQHL